MRAVILAAGYGTRLRPLTDTLPKVMLPLNSKPLIFYQIKWLKKYGIKEIAINLHHLPLKIKEYLDKNDFGVKIRYSYEKNILGTAGGVKNLENFLKKGHFMVFYGDNFTNLNIDSLLKFHKKNNGIATICIHTVDKKSVRQASIVRLAKNYKIMNFIEKPNFGDATNIDSLKDVFSNAGIYILKPQILNFIPKNKFYDFGKDVFPKLISYGEAIFGYRLNNCYWREIGTLEKYRELCKINLKG